MNHYKYSASRINISKLHIRTPFPKPGHDHVFTVQSEVCVFPHYCPSRQNPSRQNMKGWRLFTHRLW